MPLNPTPFYWLCPACSLPLTLSDKQWRCSHSHSFDVAKEGYVNLLLAQHKKSKSPGDNKDMVLARRAFLSQGHYAPLAQELAQLILTHCQFLPNDPCTLFDAGCGEGYYLRSIVEQLRREVPRIVASGVDISKPAIQKAAKHHIEQHFAVGSTFQIPIPDNSQHVALQVFAPSNSEEIKRILASSGLWISVNPGANHLQELKAKVYDNPEQHVVNEQVPNGFELVLQKTISFELKLDDPETRRNLLMMTPFYWTVSALKKEQLLETLNSVGAQFDIKVMKCVDTL